MADYLDIGYFTETHTGKKRFVKLGYAAPMREGDGFYLNFDPHLFPGQGVVMKPQRERSEAQSTSHPTTGSNAGVDDIPF